MARRDRRGVSGAAVGGRAGARLRRLLAAPWRGSVGGLTRRDVCTTVPLPGRADDCCCGRAPSLRPVVRAHQLDATATVSTGAHE